MQSSIFRQSCQRGKLILGNLCSADAIDALAIVQVHYSKFHEGENMAHGSGEDEGTTIGYSTARGRDWPSVRQYNVFLENRMGALMNMVRRFETTDIHIVAITVVDSTDCAIIRLVLSDPERAREIFEQAHLPITESDLLVVQLPETRQPLAQICKALLAAEINIHYAYPLMVGAHGNGALALHVDDHEMAVQTMQRAGFTLLSENDFIV
jgi:hypothetical protein